MGNLLLFQALAWLSCNAMQGWLYHQKLTGMTRPSLWQDGSVAWQRYACWHEACGYRYYMNELQFTRG